MPNKVSQVRTGESLSYSCPRPPVQARRSFGQTYVIVCKGKYFMPSAPGQRQLHVQAGFNNSLAGETQLSSSPKGTSEDNTFAALQLPLLRAPTTWATLVRLQRTGDVPDPRQMLSVLPFAPSRPSAISLNNRRREASITV